MDAASLQLVTTEIRETLPQFPHRLKLRNGTDMLARLLEDTAAVDGVKAAMANRGDVAALKSSIDRVHALRELKAPVFAAA
jgi:hypothetical protein